MSTIKVDTIKKVNDSVPKASDLGLNITGNVIQVVTSTIVTSTTTTSTSFVTTGLTVNITPTSSSNKVSVFANFYSGFPATNYATVYTLYRGSTNLDAGSGRTGFTNVGATAATDFHLYQGRSVALQILDSPSTTSETAYALFFKVDAGTGYFNINRNGDAAAKATAVITCMEVAG